MASTAAAASPRRRRLSPSWSATMLPSTRRPAAPAGTSRGWPSPDWPSPDSPKAGAQGRLGALLPGALMGRREKLSSSEARRLALAAQGLAEPRTGEAGDWRRLRRSVKRLGLLQIDSVN